MCYFKIFIVVTKLARLTTRCSEPGHIKCLAAVVDLPSSSCLHRDRVLLAQRAVAELSRYAHY